MIIIAILLNDKVDPMILLNSFKMFWPQECEPKEWYAYLLGVTMCIVGAASYIPQYISLIKNKNPVGISEVSLLLLNISFASLALNAFILNYWRFSCYNNCGNFWICSGNLLSFFQIISCWLMAFPLYGVYLRYKIKQSKEKFLNDIIYFFAFTFATFIMVMIGITEKDMSKDSKHFFIISAWFLGILAAISSGIVWIPQIYKIIKTNNKGNLSLTMFLLQAPGSAIIIGMQIMYGQHWSTWLAYAVTLVEQLIVIVLLLRIKCTNDDLTYDDYVKYLVDPNDLFTKLDDPVETDNTYEPVNRYGSINSPDDV